MTRQSWPAADTAAGAAVDTATVADTVMAAATVTVGTDMAVATVTVGIVTVVATVTTAVGVATTVTKTADSRLAGWQDLVFCQI